MISPHSARRSRDDSEFLSSSNQVCNGANDRSGSSGVCICAPATHLLTVRESLTCNANGIRPSHTTMASNVLPLFWQLSSNDRKARLDASEELVLALQTFQNQHGAKQGTSSGSADGGDMEMASEDGDDDDDSDGDESGVEVDEDDDMDAEPKKTKETQEEDAEIAQLDRRFESANATDVQYSIKRLIRGLASSRENSRFGFAVALTEVSYGSIV
jgi:hypothetical protein